MIIEPGSPIERNTSFRLLYTSVWFTRPDSPLIVADIAAAGQRASG